MAQQQLNYPQTKSAFRHCLETLIGVIWVIDPVWMPTNQMKEVKTNFHFFELNKG
jgi:hypothetical protein